MSSVNHPAIDVGRDLLSTKIGEAIACLASGYLGDEQVHAARKALKGARTALRLLRPRLDDAVYSHQNAVLRDAARNLSHLRDSRSLLEAVDLLNIASRRRRPVKAALARLRPLLQVRLDHARKVLAENPSLLRDCTNSLRGSLECTLAALGNAGDDRQLIEAFVRIYRKARKSFQKAGPTSSVEVLHKWRKQTKYLLTAAAVLRESGKKNLRAVVIQADRVADQLGDDHDLAILARTLTDLVGASDSRLLLPLIEARCVCLRRKALREGAKLFARSSHHAAARLSDRKCKKLRRKAWRERS